MGEINFLVQKAGHNPDSKGSALKRHAIGITELDADVILVTEFVLVNNKAKTAADRINVAVDRKQHSLRSHFILHVVYCFGKSHPLLAENGRGANGIMASGVSRVDGHLIKHVLSKLSILLCVYRTRSQKY
ncbi:hypothetical protein DSECCO2_652440 [anaerobic digester metagenome]